jgi:hypothetical protein
MCLGKKKYTKWNVFPQPYKELKYKKNDSGKEETQVGFKFVATKRNDAAFPSV